MAASSLDLFLAATRAKESNNNYKAFNPDSGVSGAYQYKDSTWGNYKGYRRAMDAPPAIQDEKARIDAQALYSRFGNWRDVAIAWYGGPGAVTRTASAKAASQGSYPSINAYADDIMRRMGQPTGTVRTASVGSAVMATTRPTTRAGIRTLQQQMKDAGFDPGPIDGIWGPRTQAAYDRYSAQGAPAAPTTRFPNLAGLSDDDKITAMMFTEQGQAVAPFLNDPQIRTIFLRYIRGEIDEGTLSGLVAQTPAYRNTTQTQRQWDALVNTNPATATAALDQAKAGLLRMAAQLGYTLTDAQVTALATATLRDGYNEDQAKVWIVATQAISGGGNSAQVLTDINHLLTSWMVDMSDQSKRDWMSQILIGQQTPENFQEFVRGRAMSAYPTMAAALAANPNLTPDQFVDGYRQAAVKYLGVNPATIDFRDAKWKRSIQTVDSKTMQWRAMTEDEWEREMKSNPEYGWRYTKDAQNQKAALLMTIGEAMGRIRT